MLFVQAGVYEYGNDWRVAEEFDGCSSTTDGERRPVVFCEMHSTQREHNQELLLLMFVFPFQAGVPDFKEGQSYLKLYLGASEDGSAVTD